MTLLARVLLVSTLSVTVLSQSAFASTQYEPVAVDDGTCSVVDSTFVAPGPSDGTGRLPSQVSAASQVVLVDR